MGEIQEFQEADIAEIAALELKVFRHQNRPAPPTLQAYFDEIFLRNPWRDAGISSLVYREEGRIVGFLGVLPRRMMFCNRPIRVAVASQFMVDRVQYRGFAGLELMRHFFKGPQELSLTDGATEASHALWKAGGGHAAQLYSLEWTRVLRPLGHTCSEMKQKKGPWKVLGNVARPLCALTDAGLSRLPIGRFAVRKSDFQVEKVASEPLLQCMSQLGWREALKPDYDAASFSWLMRHAAQARRHGTLQMAVVRDHEGVLAGWFVYYARPHGDCRVLQIGAKERNFDGVFQALMYDAWMQGATTVSGQVIPRFLWNFSNQHCVLRYPGSGVLVHARDPEILAAVYRGDAVLTRLDGEWWMHFATDEWR